MSNTSPTAAVPLMLQQEPLLIRRRILWLMGVRLLCSTLLMGGTVIFQMQGGRYNSHPTENFVFWLIGAIYFLTLFYSFIFPKIQRLRMFGAIQLSGDILVISLLVMATGCQDSLFLFCYLLVIIGAAFVLYRSGAFLFAGASLFMLAMVLFGTMFSSIRMLPFVRTSLLLKPPELFYILAVHAPAFFLIAFLSSHLVEQIRHTGEILKQQQIDFDNLEALHKDIIESLTSGLIATDMTSRIQFFNVSGCALLGASGDELLGRPLDEVIPGAGELWLEHHARLPRRHRRIEFSYLHPDGQRRILGCGFAPLHNAEDKEIGALLLFQDLTPIKQIEETAKEREKLASLGTMAAGLAHEIRNPLSSLSGAVQLLQSELTIQEDDRVLMNIVVQETERLNRLLSDFLMFARPKTIQKQRLSLSALLQETAYLFDLSKQHEQVHVVLEVDSPCTIDADAQLLHQILWNLLLNGAQAMPPDGGQITLRGEMVEAGTVLQVIDQGGGIPLALNDQIFEPFFSTKDSGTGLGLAVVRRIISEHQGYIVLADAADGHTCFELFFPLDEQLHSAAPASARPISEESMSVEISIPHTAPDADAFAAASAQDEANEIASSCPNEPAAELKGESL